MRMTTNEASSQSSSRWYQSGINKPPVSTEGFLCFEYPAYLSRLKRADERAVGRFWALHRLENST
jgi:hypothetical protein